MKVRTTSTLTSMYDTMNFQSCRVQELLRRSQSRSGAQEPGQSSSYGRWQGWQGAGLGRGDVAALIDLAYKVCLSTQ